MTMIRRLRMASALTVAVTVVLVGGGASVRADSGAANGANGVRLVVSPRTIDDLTGEVQVRVSGSGFSTTENGAVGIYLSYGEQPTGDRIGNRAFTDVTVAYDGGPGHGTKWIRPQTPSGANQGRLEADGTFSVQLSVRARFTAPNGDQHSSETETLGIYGYAAHGTEAQASGFSQRVFVALRFEAPATPKPTAKPTAKPTPRLTAAPTPRPTAARTSLPSQAAASSPSSVPSLAPTDSATADPVPVSSSPAASGSQLASGPPGPSSDPSPSPTVLTAPFDGDAASAAGAGIGPAIPLAVGLLVLVLVAVRWLLTRRSGQRS